jgi:hypothetical protein
MPIVPRHIRLARERRKDAMRQQRRRDRMAKARIPPTHAVDSALVQALAYTVHQHWLPGQARHAVIVPFKAVLLNAIEILTSGDRYDEKEAARAVAARTRDRKPLSWRLEEPQRPEQT